MARINAKGLLSETVANYTFRVVNGVGILQSKPAKGRARQTAATKCSASEFGYAHALAKKIRMAQFPLLQGLSDARMYNRFATAVYKAVLGAADAPKGGRTLADGDLEVLEHFQFNSDSPFPRYCHAPIGVDLDGENRIRIALGSFYPRRDIAAVEGASQGKLAFLVTAFDPVDGTEGHAELFESVFAVSGEATAPMEWISGALPAGHVVLVAVALSYYRQTKLAGAVGLNSRKLHPSEILKVVAL